jgi:hypothetical protein
MFRPFEEDVQGSYLISILAGEALIPHYYCFYLVLVSFCSSSFLARLSCNFENTGVIYSNLKFDVVIYTIFPYDTIALSAISSLPSLSTTNYRL